MAKSLGLALLLALVTLNSAAVTGAGADSFAEEVPSTTAWRRSLGVGKEKVTKLHFYFHEIISGNNPSAIRIAQAATTGKSPTLFGLLAMADDALTVGPEPDSKVVGRAQGTYGSSGQVTLDFLMTMNFCFTHGKYNRSCISILSRNSIMASEREMAIVGGTGVFRLARGVAMAKTHWFNATTGDAIVEYHLTVLHYD